MVINDSLELIDPDLWPFNRTKFITSSGLL